MEILKPINNTLIKYLVVAIAMLIFGGMLEAYFDPFSLRLSNLKRGQDIGYQLGYEIAKKTYLNSPLGKMYSNQGDVYTLTGTVVSKNNNQFVLHFESMDPFVDHALNNRTVIISTSTSIIKLKQRDMLVFQSEMEQFMKDAEKPNVPGEQKKSAPSFFNEVLVTFDNIEIGDSVEVISSKNIKDIKSFSADTIKIQTKGDNLQQSSLNKQL